MEKDGNYYMEGILDDIQQDGYGFLEQSTILKVRKIFIFLPAKFDVLRLNVAIK